METSCQPGLATSFQLVRLVGCDLKQASRPPSVNSARDTKLWIKSLPDEVGLNLPVHCWLWC